MARSGLLVVKGDVERLPAHDASVQRYLKELRNYPPMTRQEEEKTVRLAKKGDRQAAERLITSNLRFVVKVALKYQGHGLPLADLIAEGNAGLMVALDRFDEERGLKFISYAVWWIRQAILSAIKQHSVVRHPLNQLDDMGRIARRRGQLTQELGREPTLDEVAGDMKISRKRAELALRCISSDLSLDAPIDPFGDKELYNFFPSEDPETDQRVLERDRLELITTAITQCLNKREARVIRACFGLGGEERRTLGEIGANLGVTRERVRQIRNRALEKLKIALGPLVWKSGELWEDVL
ncbi:MAG: hypothetical protein A3H70_02180 [Candidatus Komeilibacteria bacterium RIFCSPLOWO2_02_FULL_48_11]|uniref:RNA polymerase subunit sigma n=1 Tax=Candidatus Komeilibacteria bacterium RIFCSPLOWO2_02_FULL_48_11 TaxID=1798553 RepID=A0A1G2BUD1_9BACT|nr:MAG: hypothetical protein A3H70_02180 [Candidatus Komeilibacteria bacterium RIFCSPLOWO2_02_FULL_48_11]